MAKVNRKIPLYVRMGRLRDYKIKKECKDREKIRYPNCLGLFEECVSLIPGQICSDCTKCFHFCKETYEKLQGGENMKEKVKHEESVKAEIQEKKQKVDKEQERADKIKLMMENYIGLKPAQRAWLRIYANRGLLDKVELEKLENKAGSE